MTFERQDGAERVMDVLGERMGRFGLTLHPDETRLLPFRRPPAAQTSGKGPATFDFLGFTLHYERARSGRWAMMCKTRHARLRRSIQAIADWCRRHRHQPVNFYVCAVANDEVRYWGPWPNIVPALWRALPSGRVYVCDASQGAVHIYDDVMGTDRSLIRRVELGFAPEGIWGLDEKHIYVWGIRRVAPSPAAPAVGGVPALAAHEMEATATVRHPPSAARTRVTAILCAGNPRDAVQR
ncbi:MAG: hypothetical protein KF718_31150 [Polyangiaceae bacterium]|nr:hypothetical protein [Polyangiaceae bacterium]